MMPLSGFNFSVNVNYAGTLVMIGLILSFIGLCVKWR